MRKIDLSGMSSADLKALKNQIDSEMKAIEAKEKAIEEVKKLAAAKGVDLRDVFGEPAKPGRARKTRGVVPVKFRHPKDASLTWTGRGKQPNWIKDAMAKGMKMTDLEV